MHAHLLARTYMYSTVQSCTCSPDGFCIAPDTIAYAKVSGAERIAWRTQLHLTPVSDVIHESRSVTSDVEATMRIDWFLACLSQTLCRN